jgi:SAM-dependent methyltransferase
LAITAEGFKPPLFKPGTSIQNRLENRLRRFLDVQAGSLWRDLALELGQVRGNLLDVGCGAQIYRTLLPSQAVYQGIDTADAEAHFGYSMPDTHYFKNEDWGVKDGGFDTVLCTEVLEHVTDPSAFLARVFRCLSPGGRLVLTVPFAARWHFIPYDYWRFTPSGLFRLLSESGFDDVRVQARGNPLTVACYKIMTLQLILLFGPRKSVTDITKRSLGILMLPILGLLACVANMSLRSDWGDDCLGYTVTASRAIEPRLPTGNEPE